ncbi:MAG: transaldolase [Nitrospira sp.]|nr:transaldolase [Nitrospira sp.]
MITSGELLHWINQRGLRGITTNPMTFRDAIASQDYDQDIASLRQQGYSAKDMYEALLVADVQQACDLLYAVYAESDGLDGFVSLELSPHVAHDSKATIAEARRYVERVKRPNLFIKIPATDAGIPAIEQLLYKGIAINITLLFSIPSYQAVIEAYLSALERRLTDHLSIEKITSVASFFVSCIDVLVDQLLRRRIPLDDQAGQSLAARLQGRSAIANAKLAYRTFQQAFASERWARLAEAGARVQRPLWASTGTKNPAYPDTLYVDALVGRDTVNMMPETTLQAFADHGQVVPDAVESDVEEAKHIMQQIEEVGISFNCVTWQLEHEGVQKCVDAYDNAVQILNDKRREIMQTGSIVRS